MIQPLQKDGEKAEEGTEGKKLLLAKLAMHFINYIAMVHVHLMVILVPCVVLGKIKQEGGGRNMLKGNVE